MSNTKPDITDTEAHSEDLRSLPIEQYLAEVNRRIEAKKRPKELLPYEIYDWFEEDE